MNFNVKKIEYCNIESEYPVSEASKLLSTLVRNGIDFLAYKATAIENRRTVFTLFSENAHKMLRIAKNDGYKVEGPFSAILVVGEEKIGALAAIYGKLSQANINVMESSGIAHINGAFGVILYLEKEDCDRALVSLKN